MGNQNICVGRKLQDLDPKLPSIHINTPSLDLSRDFAKRRFTFFRQPASGNDGAVIYDNRLLSVLRKFGAEVRVIEARRVGLATATRRAMATRLSLFNTLYQLPDSREPIEEDSENSKGEEDRRHREIMPQAHSHRLLPRPCPDRTLTISIEVAGVRPTCAATL